MTPAIFPAGVPGYTAEMVPTRTGHRLRVIEIGQLAAPAVLCVHGWGCTAYTFRNLLPSLAAAGHRALGIDLLGHGLSDKPRSQALYGLDALANQVLDVLDRMQVGSLTLVGHSLGGEVVARVAALAPERVRRLVLLAPVGLAPVRLLPLARLATPVALEFRVPRSFVKLALWLAFSSKEQAASGTPLFTADDVDQYWAPTKTRGFVVAMRNLVHVFPWRMRDSAWVRTIACPTLVITGTGDRLVSPRSGAMYAQIIPHATLRTLSGAGHSVTGRTPTEMDAAVVAFASASAEPQ